MSFRIEPRERLDPACVDLRVAAQWALGPGCEAGQDHARGDGELLSRLRAPAGAPSPGSAPHFFCFGFGGNARKRFRMQLQLGS